MNWQDIALWVGPALLVLWLVWFLWSNREAAHMQQAIRETNADLLGKLWKSPRTPWIDPEAQQTIRRVVEEREAAAYFKASGKLPDFIPPGHGSHIARDGHVVIDGRSPQWPPHPLPASPVPREETYRLNSDKSVAVATDYYTNPDMSQCPRGVKLILIGKGGVGTIAIYDGDPFWIEWAPMPKRSTGSSTG